MSRHLSASDPVIFQSLCPSYEGQVLIAETKAPIRDAIVVSLAEEGFQTQVVGSGQQVLKLVCSSAEGELPVLPIYLIILGQTLPDLSGLEICRQLRQQANSIPVLLIGENGSETDVVEGLEAGADDYLKQPFGMRELVARCRVLLRRYEPSVASFQTSILRFRDIELDCDQHRVTVQGKEINLSPKEFSLLKLFMTYPRQVISREQLLEEIWGSGFSGDPKTIDVHIRWLREKLEVDPGNPGYLVTVRGFGYRLG